MNDREDDLLVYLAGSVGADPAKKEEFLVIVEKGGTKLSDGFRLAVQELFALSQKAERRSSLHRPYRRTLVDLARDRVVVSRLDPRFPLNAAKLAILTACDFR